MTTTINLLPWREKTRAQAKRVFIACCMGAVIIACVINGVWYNLLQQRINQQNNRNAYLQTAIQLTQQNPNEKKAFETQKQKTLNQATTLKNINNQRFRLLELIQALPKLLPSGVFIEAIHVKAEVIELQGTAKTDIQVPEFVQRLKLEPNWQQIQLQELNTDTTHATTFKLTLSLD